MLYAKGKSRAADTTRSAVRTRDPRVSDLLLDVLESVESYDAHILEAEKNEDLELAAFLRELRRQDLVRSTGIVRLLRRSREGESEGIGEEAGAC